MAMPVVALLLTGGGGIADDGDGDDSDCGEDKLHDGGKLHAGGTLHHGGKLHDALSHEYSMPDTPFPRVS